MLRALRAEAFGAAAPETASLVPDYVLTIIIRIRRLVIPVFDVVDSGILFSRRKKAGAGFTPAPAPSAP